MGFTSITTHACMSPMNLINQKHRPRKNKIRKWTHESYDDQKKNYTSHKTRKQRTITFEKHQILNLKTIPEKYKIKKGQTWARVSVLSTFSMNTDPTSLWRTSLRRCCRSLQSSSKPWNDISSAISSVVSVIFLLKLKKLCDLLWYLRLWEGSKIITRETMNDGEEWGGSSVFVWFHLCVCVWVDREKTEKCEMCELGLGKESRKCGALMFYRRRRGRKILTRGL